MARISGYWTTEGTTPVGHQVAGYTQSHERIAATIIASCHGNNGVAPNLLNALVGSHPSANTVRIGTGGAVVDGKWFLNDAAYDVNIPSAGAGTIRKDRVLLRADWAGFIVEIQVKTGDAVNPPALAQTSESIYEIPLYIAEVTDAGVVTLTDERQFAQVQTAGVADDAVSNAKLRNSVSTSVIGRSSGTTGDPADIQATTNDRLLARVSGALSWVQLTIGMIPDLLITSAKLAANAVIAGKLADGAVDTTARLANDIVDDTKVGNRVPQFYRRQGGSATDWASLGVSDFTPGAVRIQAGLRQMSIGAGSSQADITVTFPVAFSNNPLVFVTLAFTDLGLRYIERRTTNPGDVVIRAVRDGTSGTTNLVAMWLAIGPE
jgi:hypothetical protein